MSMRPRPHADQASEPFWAAAREGRLVVQRYCNCRTFHHQPLATCIECGAAEFEWPTMSGRATLHSWSTMYQSAGPFAERTPYTFLVVELVEERGLFMLSDFVDRELRLDSLVTGAAMHVDFMTCEDDFALPQFTFTRSADDVDA